MCAMTRQPLLGRLVFVALVAALGAAVLACGLDKEGTEFVALQHGSRLDAGIASGTPARPDAASAEAAAQVPLQTLGPPDAAVAPGSLPEAALSPASSVDDADGPEAALDGALADVTAPGADAAPEAAPPPVTSCDQDGDGHLAAGPPCFGDDCCDTDGNVHPGQTGYFTSVSLCGSFDYDCDGASTPEYGVANCQWVGLGCMGDGFVATTACGDIAAFSVCSSASVLTCTASVGSLTQACR
jgi:hypothetical protein